MGNTENLPTSNQSHPATATTYPAHIIYPAHITYPAHIKEEQLAAKATPSAPTNCF